MELGFWINHSTNKVFRIDEHERWIRRWGNAKKAGITETMYNNFLKKFEPGTDRDKMLLWLLNRTPLIRVRGHGTVVAFEFASERLRPILDAIYDWGQDYAGDYSNFHIVNLKTKKSTNILFKNYAKYYEEGREDAIMENSTDIKIIKSFKQFMVEKAIGEESG